MCYHPLGQRPIRRDQRRRSPRHLQRLAQRNCNPLRLVGERRELGEAHPRQFPLRRWQAVPFLRRKGRRKGIRYCPRPYRLPCLAIPPSPARHVAPCDAHPVEQDAQMVLWMAFDTIIDNRIPLIRRAGEIDARQDDHPPRHPRHHLEQFRHGRRRRRDPGCHDKSGRR